MTEKTKKRRVPSVAASREANGRASSVPINPAARFARAPLNSKSAEVEEVERLARHLVTLPESYRTAAALRAFPRPTFGKLSIYMQRAPAPPRHAGNWA